MNRYKLGCIDCIWKRCRNVHLLESIKIYFYIDSWDHYVIEYNFHQKDFYLWKDILEIHRENIDDCTLYDDLENKVLESLENEFEYYVLRLKSKDINLYRNISLIMYIKDENGWDNSEEMLKRNTWDL
jgi:hypothetical protein